MAMYVLEQQWLQVILFMCMNLFSFIFVLVVKPFQNNSMNYLSALNEFFAVLISYLILQINNPAYGPEINVVMGEVLTYLIYLSWGCNGLVITFMSVWELSEKCKAIYVAKCRRQTGPKCPPGEAARYETKE